MTDQTETYRLCRVMQAWGRADETKRAALEAVLGLPPTDEPVGSKRKSANA